MHESMCNKLSNRTECIKVWCWTNVAIWFEKKWANDIISITFRREQFNEPWIDYWWLENVWNSKAEQSLKITFCQVDVNKLLIRKTKLFILSFISNNKIANKYQNILLLLDEFCEEILDLKYNIFIVRYSQYQKFFSISKNGMQWFILASYIPWKHFSAHWLWFTSINNGNSIANNKNPYWKKES